MYYRGASFEPFAGHGDVDVLSAKYEEQEYHRRPRRGGQNQQDAAAQRNGENMRRLPVLVGEVDALRQGLHQRPLPVGLQHLQTEEKGASCFTIGYSHQTEVPSEKKIGYSGQTEKPAQFACSDQTEESSEKDGVSSRLMHVRKDYHFTQRILHPQLYIFLTLVAQEPWDLEKQLMPFADILTHIPTVVFGMKFNRRIQDFSLQTLNNPSVLRRLSFSCMTMDGILNSQRSTWSKKLMSYC